MSDPLLPILFIDLFDLLQAQPFVPLLICREMDTTVPPGCGFLCTVAHQI